MRRVGLSTELRANKTDASTRETDGFRRKKQDGSTAGSCAIRPVSSIGLLKNTEYDGGGDIDSWIADACKAADLPFIRRGRSSRPQ